LIREIQQKLNNFTLVNKWVITLQKQYGRADVREETYIIDEDDIYVYLYINNNRSGRNQITLLLSKTISKEPEILHWL
jgi:hypothetical protein